MRLLPAILATLLISTLVAAAQDAASDDGSEGDNSDTIHAGTTIYLDGSKTVTVTNPDNHTSEVSRYDAANKLIQKMVYTLGDDKQPVSGVVYDENNQAIYKTVYKRDEMNRIAEEDDYTVYNRFIRRLVFQYGLDGKPTGIRTYSTPGDTVASADDPGNTMTTEATIPVATPEPTAIPIATPAVIPVATPVPAATPSMVAPSVDLH
jgi:hypothetical protein